MSEALPLTPCWDIWGNKIRVVLLRASVRARSLLGPCAHLNGVKIVTKRGLRKWRSVPSLSPFERPNSCFFFPTFGSLRTLRLGAAAWQTGCSDWELWGDPIPAPRHCGQAEIYAHCRKRASIHWLQLLHKSGSLLPQQIRWSEQRDQLRDRPVICKA